MRRIPWHVSIRLDRKGALTAAGVALGVAFALASLSVAGGLQAATEDLGSRHSASGVVVLRRDLGPLPVDITEAAPNATLGWIFPVVDQDGGTLFLGAFPNATIRDGVAFPVAPKADGASLKLREPNATLEVGPPSRDGPIRVDYLVSERTMRALGAQGPNLLSVPSMDEAEAVSLRASGYLVERSPALSVFFADAGREVARDLLLVVAFSSALAAVFAYEFMSSEIREARREIGLWRALGLRASDVTALLLARTSVIAALGIAAGAVLSFLVLSTAARLTRHAVLSTPPSEGVMALVLGASLLASVAGALVPAGRAAYASVRSSLEVAA